MQATSTMTGWLDHLRAIAPIQGLVHIGPSTGIPLARYREWQPPRLILVDPDPVQQDKLAALAAGQPGWSTHPVLVSDHECEVDYYAASNPNESGVIPPERLAPLWKNLQTLGQRKVQATTLHRLLSQVSQHDNINWVAVDCLPALSVLKGAGELLRHWDVVIARVVLDEALLPGSGASQREVDSFLVEQGFHCAGVEQERHPALGLALYLRDWKAALAALALKAANAKVMHDRAIAELQTACDEQSQLANQRQQQVEQLAKARDEQSQLANQRQQQVEQLAKARDEQSQLANQRQQQLEQLTKARDEQSQLANQRQQQIEQLTKARDEQSQLANQRQQQVEQLTRGRVDLEQQIASLNAQLEQLVANHKSQLEQLTKREEALTQELREARQTAALSVRLQALREADLKDLQDRYQSSAAAQERQQQLLAKLSERLSVASAYFHQLPVANEQAPALGNGAGVTKRRRRMETAPPAAPAKPAKRGARP